MNKNEKLDQLADEELMSLYQKGEYAAFECLYRRYEGKVFHYLNKKVSRDIAEDLVQEIFIKLHKARHQYSEQYPFLPWLFTISRNALFDYFKLTKKIAVLPWTSEINLVPDPEVPLAEVDLSAALKHLPENQKRAIELRYLEDWSFEKIAKEIQTSPENVRQLISRGLKKVRNGLRGS